MSGRVASRSERAPNSSFFSCARSNSSRSMRASRWARVAFRVRFSSARAAAFMAAIIPGGPPESPALMRVSGTFDSADPTRANRAETGHRQVHAFQQQQQVRARNRPLNRLAEAAFLQPLVGQPETVTIPPQQLHLVPAPVEKHEHRTR